MGRFSNERLYFSARMLLLSNANRKPTTAFRRCVSHGDEQPQEVFSGSGPERGMVSINFSESELRPLVRSVVAEVMAEINQLQNGREGQVAYTEAEAANMLGLKQHQLRDRRLAGKISFTRIVGRRIRYTLPDLMAYLSENREEAA